MNFCRQYKRIPGLGAAAELLGVAITGEASIRVIATGRQDTAKDQAQAIGLHLAVSTDARLRLCVPNGTGGCIGSVTITASATVLEATLAAVAVERPELAPGTAAWHILLGAVGGLVLAALLGWAIIRTLRVRREQYVQAN